MQRRALPLLLALALVPSLTACDIGEIRVAGFRFTSPSAGSARLRRESGIRVARACGAHRCPGVRRRCADRRPRARDRAPSKYAVRSTVSRPASTSCARGSRSISSSADSRCRSRRLRPSRSPPNRSFSVRESVEQVARDARGAGRRTPVARRGRERRRQRRGRLPGLADLPPGRSGRRLSRRHHRFAARGVARAARRRGGRQHAGSVVLRRADARAQATATSRRATARSSRCSCRCPVRRRTVPIRCW